MRDKYDLLIDGEWTANQSSERLEVTNPANGETVARCALAGRTEAQVALQAAHTAFPEWARTPARERAELLHAAMDLFRERLEDIAVLLTREQGKPLRDAQKELRFSADVIDYYAEEGRRLYDKHFAGDASTAHSFTLRQPIGVVATITPWNFPVDLLSWKVGPALAVGCTLVAKPPLEAPLSSIEFLRCFHDVGLPPGVINVVTGPGSEVGAELVTNPLSRKIAFTGSTATGEWIAQEAGRGLKRVTLELGGSAPFIVCPDADLDWAVPQALRRSFSHTGQICISVNRIFVHEDIAGAFTERFAEAAAKLRVADGLAVPDADMGPMINEEGRQKVREHVADAVEKGAQILTGGQEPDGPEFSEGFFYLPTVLTNVAPNMHVMQEETFGPVVPIATFKTLDEGIAMANNSPYGLAAFIFTRDLDTATYAAERLEAGGVGININDVTDIRGPWGGWKASGIGRELGEPGLDSYLQWKHIRVQRRDPDW